MPFLGGNVKVYYFLSRHFQREEGANSKNLIIIWRALKMPSQEPVLDPIDTPAGYLFICRGIAKIHPCIIARFELMLFCHYSV
jgi:hypothetical protein